MSRARSFPGWVGGCGPRPGIVFWVLLAWALAGPAASADPVTLDFNGLPHGTVVTQFGGVTVTVTNPNSPAWFQQARAFSTTEMGVEDTDLQPPWTGGGNLSEGLGNILIIQEYPGTGAADDEGNRPAGVIRLDFGQQYNQFGLDLVDVGDDSEELLPDKAKLAFFLNGSPVGSVSFQQLAALDPTIKFGDDTANRVPVFSVQSVAGGAGVFDRVDIYLGGSGGIDNVQAALVAAQAEAVPEPGGLVLWAVLGLFGMTYLGERARRRRLPAGAV